MDASLLSYPTANSSEGKKSYAHKQSENVHIYAHICTHMHTYLAQRLKKMFRLLQFTAFEQTYKHSNTCAKTFTHTFTSEPILVYGI